MEKYYKYLAIIPFITVIIIALQACAVMQPLSGGPDDTTPPEVTEVYPENNTLNFDDNVLKLRFSEYLDKASAVENIRITPSLKVNYSWSGKQLRIKMLENPKPNTTYCLTIEAGYKDLSGNPPSHTQSFIFSTGNNIDSAYISGRTNKLTGYTLFAYKLDGINADTLDIRRNAPDYSLKIGGSGEFKLQALPEGKYRLFLVNDRNSDGLYTEGSEEIALFTRDLNVSMTHSPKNVVFHKAKLFDYSSPEIMEATAMDSRTVLAKFNKPIDTNSIDAGAFYVVNSTNRRIPAIAAYIAPKDSQSVLINTASAINEDEEYHLIIEKLSDINANSIKEMLKSDSFFGSGKRYDVSPVTIAFSIKDSVKDIPLSAEFYVDYSRAIKEPNMGNITLKQEGKKKALAVSAKFINSNRMAISPESPLVSNTNYSIEVGLSEVQSVFDEAVSDTTISASFTTEDLRLNGSAFGTLKVNGTNIYNSKKYQIILSSADSKREVITYADSLGNWSFPSLKEGEYNISIAIDENENGIIDYGRVFPYTPAERYIPNAKQIKIAQRWKIDNIIVEIED